MILKYSFLVFPSIIAIQDQIVLPILVVLLIFLGVIFYKYTLKAEIEDREDKPREKGIAVTMICAGVLLMLLFLISLA